MAPIAWFTAALLAFGSAAPFASVQSDEPLCFVISDTAVLSRNHFYIRLDADGRVGFSEAVAPSTAPDHYWSWKRVGDSARVKFSGIDSGEDFQLRIRLEHQRVAREMWWDTNGPHHASDSVDVHAVDCPTVKSFPPRDSLTPR